MTKPMNSQTKAKIAKSVEHVHRTGKRVTDGKPAGFKKGNRRPKASKGVAGKLQRTFGKPGLARTLLESGASIGAGAITGAIAFKHPVGAAVGAGLGAMNYLLFRPKDKRR